MKTGEEGVQDAGAKSHPRGEARLKEHILLELACQVVAGILVVLITRSFR